MVQELSQRESGSGHGFVFQGTASESGGTSVNAWNSWGESKVGQRDGAYSLHGNRGRCPTM